MLLAFLALLLVPACAAPPEDIGNLATPVEHSTFTRTTRLTEAVDFCRRLEKASSHLRLEIFGETAEGRPMPLAVMGNPPPAGPEAVDRDRTTVVFINANIHAGEVAGKEACLMLMRDLLAQDPVPYLDHTVLLVCPVYNGDGNERIDPANRFWQPNPEGGVGIRQSAQDLDLNRDQMKMDSPEARALIEKILVRWDPDLVVDCHTTNGSYHQEPITYAHPHTPVIHDPLMTFNRDVMLPWIVKHCREMPRGYLAIPYGNFRNSGSEQGWYSFDHRPRYLSNYAGLRNSLSILIEMYVYASYEDRVRACRDFLESILAFADAEGETMRAVNRAADASAVAAASPGGTPLRFHREFEIEALENPITIKGYTMKPGEDSRGRKRMMPDFENPEDYTVPYYGAFRIMDEGTPLPDYYVFPRALVEIRDKLRSHGIVVETLDAPFTAEGEVFRIEKIEVDERLYQGHRLTTLTGEWKREKAEFPGGAFLVPAAQAQARLAAYLLEPRSDDGLATWNFMDRYLNRGVWDRRPGKYPVVKISRSDLPEGNVPDEKTPVGPKDREKVSDP